MEYHFKSIEEKWQAYWKTHQIYKTTEDYSKPKYYVLDMFPYPSGSGLHVGHPLGYIASDIVARYKRLQGFNVLHPMGFDSFGLPAEQYAIQTGQHPARTTEQNIARYREQLDKMGFSYDWSREVRTSDPQYYRWTQWIFLKLYNSWFNYKTQRAEPIDQLEKQFSKWGFKKNTDSVLKHSEQAQHVVFSAEQWQQYSELEKNSILMHYRLAYLGDAYVNWCAVLGTVLANDEVKDGLSERGGYPVERKLMKQWSLRITAYAQRLLDGLQQLDWSASLKESQRNWIGRSEGCSIKFKMANSTSEIEVFTTRPDTIFGVSFIAVAPEHDGIAHITDTNFKSALADYCKTAKMKSERERQADVKTVSGQFMGVYAIHPFNGALVPVYCADYVLAGYGSGAIMGVPAHDARDFRFAQFFNLPIVSVIESADNENQVNESRNGVLKHSDFLNGLTVEAAIVKSIAEIESRNCGTGMVNYKLRDAVFGRQRYWGEPIPMYYESGYPKALPESELPLVLPEIDQFLPTENGDPPLARATTWRYNQNCNYEYTTMPGWAGSSWYYLRYMDPNNAEAFADTKALEYWNAIDLYIGGSEHATGHLLYVRFWSMVLYDLGLIPFAEPIKKLVNQGMIQGTSVMIHRDVKTQHIISAGLAAHRETTKIHIDVNLAEHNIVNTNALSAWRDDFKNVAFELEQGKLIAETTVEKMSKRWHNVVNPDAICERYGADTLRMYEMFLGPLEQSKPWNTSGISGVSGFLKKLWRLFFPHGEFQISDTAATSVENKILHKCIRKITEDYERLSFNTCVSQFMITVNELQDLKCNAREILEPLLILVSPMAPHICEELWQYLGHNESICRAVFPKYNPEFIKEDVFKYPVSINGKVKLQLELPATWNSAEIESFILNHEGVIALLQGKTPKRSIIVPKKIINLVL